MDTSDFKMIILGQTICRYKAPPEVWQVFNTIYEERGSSLPNAGSELAGRLKEQRSFYFMGDKGRTISKHNVGLNPTVLHWFNDKFIHYINVNGLEKTKHRINAIWLNQYQPHEYNPVHIHQGDLDTGFTGVLMLKIPQNDIDGMLHIIGNSTGSFVRTDYVPTNLEAGDFFIFPYDMRHVVYPFSGKNNETRRTVAVNCDCHVDTTIVPKPKENLK